VRGLEVERAEAAAVCWREPVTGGVAAEPPPPRCIYTAQVNEASPDLFRPAINTPLCVVLFTVTELW